MAQFTSKPVHQLRAGDIVHMHGGVFEVQQDAHYTYWFPSTPHLGEHGPSDCAVTQGLCLRGEVQGYFAPGSTWNFQGNQLSSFAVEVQP